MASSIDHYTQAQGNEGFYETLGEDSSTTPEWAMTALFYAAVHYVQAACLHLGVNPIPKDHQSRKAAVRTQFKSVAGDFETLYHESRKARYECVKHQRHQLADARKLLKGIATETAKKASPAEYA